MTIPKECKRLAEVDFPIAAVSRHAVREKSIRHGHPSTLHLWWARRPLASSRAMLLALLLPDPADPHCPDDFRAPARAALLNLPGRPARWDDELRTGAGLRRAPLLAFIADFANWDHAAHPAYLAAGRALVQAAHPNETPLVVDPFAGGGSIPLEALRLGCDAFASDLNPVAGLILKTLLEDIPRRGPELAAELRAAGANIKAQAAAELADLYPPDPDGAVPIAYLWARTVRCESPNCGAEIPLLRSLWLCRKPKRKWALRPDIIRATGAPPRVEFAIFAPESDREVAGGTVARARATCLGCGTALPPERVRAQLAAQRGGGDTVFDEHGNRAGGARLTAVVTLKPGATGRHYRLPTDADCAAVRRAQQQVTQLLADWERNGRQGLCPVPDEPVNPIRPSPNARGLSAVTRYGMAHFGDLFTARQKAVLVRLAQLSQDSDEATRQLLAMALNRVADGSSSISRWLASGEEVKNVLSRQALAMVWDFGESNYLSSASRTWESAISTMADVIRKNGMVSHHGTVTSADATDHPLPDQSAAIWFTDPPYYDAIPYADLSDYFLVWLKRTMTGFSFSPDPFDPHNPLSPKQSECVWNQSYTHNGRPKDATFFEETIAKAFGENRRILLDDGIGGVVFAHKTTEGWEALLSGMIRGGWTITGSWPIVTESSTKPNAQQTASLITSIHLVCRPRPADAPVGDWSQVLGELPVRVGEWMERLQGEGIKGADLVFACIGPALEIFSRYSAVETPAGAVVGLPEYLEKVWEVVARAALEQVLGTPEARARNGAVGALEEDARLTALFLWTLQNTGDGEAVAVASNDEAPSPADTRAGIAGPRRRENGYTMPFDVARRFAQPLGIHLDEQKSRNIIDIDKGIVRLTSIFERRERLLRDDESDLLPPELERTATSASQLALLAPEQPLPPGRSRREFAPLAIEPEPSRSSSGQDALTTLDRVHMAMLYQASGRSQALRALLQLERERGADFLRLANALSALYPNGSPEKRLLDAMLLAAPR